VNTSGVVICPSCGGFQTEVRSGRELRVATIDLDDEQKDQP
jgi:Zn finger protein HypA/HybF involved in hydrogenase expression